MTRESLKQIMFLAWQFVRKNGYTMSEALKCAWANIRLRTKMQQGVIRFYYRKVSGEAREAFGTLKESMMPQTKGTGKKANDTLQVYYDTERNGYRSFKKANLLF
ncbi:SH3 beta-barrel fold-containing protein [Bacteroides sp.]|uniref:SH3 beta-barrel fold-containing protein n=1 Tax=Bacteroides sp. TaxID=29523 RepID=UPI002FC6F922